jgi:uncharacterized membrane protein (DUF373 family)
MPRRLFSDALFLRITDHVEKVLAKILATLLIIVMTVATIHLAMSVGKGLVDPNTVWKGEQLFFVLGDLLNLLIGLEVLQNITSYLRRGVVQIQLVLLTAITAVARKVIVLPPDAESKPQLLIGLGIAVLSLAVAYWLVRFPPPQLGNPARTKQARLSQEPDPNPPAGGGGPE